jgi:hypothetical protein
MRALSVLAEEPLASVNVAKSLFELLWDIVAVREERCDVETEVYRLGSRRRDLTRENLAYHMTQPPFQSGDSFVSSPILPLTCIHNNANWKFK